MEKKKMYYGLLLILLAIAVTACSGQNKNSSPKQSLAKKEPLVGGGCDGCELMFVRSKYLKAYFVYGNAENYNQAERRKQLEAIGSELKLTTIALTFVPSFSDTESEVNLNKINPDVDNTFVIYRNRSIVGKFIDLKATPENFGLIESTLNQTRGDYFELSEPSHD